MSIGSQRQMLQSSCSDLYARVLRKEDDDESFNATSSKSSIEDLTVSDNGSSPSSSDMEDEDDASTSWSSSSRSMASSYDLSELMAQLPIKRGLSKFYQGKSQSFTSMSRVTSIQDLPKKQTPISHRLKKMKESKSYAGGLNTYKLHTLPNPIISKKFSLSSSSFPSRRGSFVSTNSCR